MRRLGWNRTCSRQNLVAYRVNWVSQSYSAGDEADVLLTLTLPRVNMQSHDDDDDGLNHQECPCIPIVRGQQVRLWLRLKVR